MRLSHSHIRIGTFQRLAFLRDTENLKRLLDYSLATYCRHRWRQCAGRDVAARDGAARGGDRRRHGSRPGSCMACSTPTTSTSPARVSTTARGGSCRPTIRRSPPPISTSTGLYAFGRQPDALAWNLTRLAECLLPLGEHAGTGGGAQQLLAGVPARDVERGSTAAGAGVARRRGGLRAGGQDLRVPQREPDRLRAVLVRLARRDAERRARGAEPGRPAHTTARAFAPLRAALEPYAAAAARQSRPSVFRARPCRAPC